MLQLTRSEEGCVPPMRVSLCLATLAVCVQGCFGVDLMPSHTIHVHMAEEELGVGPYGRHHTHVLVGMQQRARTYEMHSSRSAIASLTRGELSHIRGAS
jgi:hypothetical protein